MINNGINEGFFSFFAKKEANAVTGGKTKVTVMFSHIKKMLGRRKE